MAYPRHQRARDFKKVNRFQNGGASNDYTLASTTYAAIDATNLTITLQAAVGDELAMSFFGRWQPISANHQGFIDGVTIVSGSPVSYMSGTGSSGDGFPGWCGQNPYVNSVLGPECNATGTMLYTVVSGDVSSGTVTVRPYWKGSVSTSRVMYARSVILVQYHLRNLGPTDPN